MRLGNKVLRQRLKGPILSAYYPRKALTIADIQKEFKRYGLETYNEDEEDRLEGLQIAKLRGKGAPKKKRTADSESLRTFDESILLMMIQLRRRAERRNRLLHRNFYNSDTLYEQHCFMFERFSSWLEACLTNLDVFFSITAQTNFEP